MKSFDQSLREWKILLAHKLHVLRLKLGWSKDAAPMEIQPDLVDGLPIPLPHLIYLVGGTTNANAFLHGGMRIGRVIREILERNGQPIECLGAILDFGCGCGRLVRQWHGLNGPKIYGTDYNPDLVRWCQANLKFAQFDTNQLAPPLRYPNATFDLVYAFSVFTHLTEDLQFAWMKELKRVLKPGGHALITVHGESSLGVVGQHHRDLFAAGQMFVLADFAVGTNLAASFHPEPYMREKLAKPFGFEVIDMVPSDVGQDFYLMRARAA